MSLRDLLGGYLWPECIRFGRHLVSTYAEKLGNKLSNSNTVCVNGMLCIQGIRDTLTPAPRRGH